MQHAGRKVVGVLGFSLPTMLVAVACSSFTTAASTPGADADADAAVTEDAAPSNDASPGPDAGLPAVPDDPVAITAAIDSGRLNDCGKWDVEASTFVQIVNTDFPSICRLCPTSNAAGGFVSLELPPTAGSYEISLDVREVSLPAKATVDFRSVATNVGEVSGTGALTTSSVYLPIARKLVPPRGAAGVRATLQTDMPGNNHCVDVKNIVVMYTPSPG